MTIDFTRGDDLSDLLGGTAPIEAPRQLPQDAQLARIRDRAVGEQPAAPLFKVPCKKCGGRGRFISYSGRDCGPCFTCKGKGHFERKNSAQALAANRDKAQERKMNREVENLEAFKRDFAGHWAWIEKTAKVIPTERNRGFIELVQSMPLKIMQYGDLHSGLMAVIERGMARDAERAAQAPQKAAQAAPQLDVANIVDCFQRAQEAGLQRFTLRFDGIHFQVDRRDPALIWISEGGYGTAKYGRIQGGVYKPGRDTSPAVIAKVVEIAKDPMAAAMAYAQLTSSCSVCGRHLENQDSVDAGIGPVCAGRINRPGIKMVPVAEGDF